MSTLEGWIAAALQRLAEAADAAEQERRAREQERLISIMRQFQGELDRALGPELLAALGGDITLLPSNGRAVYAFAYRGLSLTLEYTEEHESRIWYVNCPAISFGKNVAERVYREHGSSIEPLSFRDRLVLTIAEAGPPAARLDQAA